MAKQYPKDPYLNGNFAPLRMEYNIDDLIIEGEFPKEINGSYFRIGPDPQFAPRGSHHWFGGDGMIHAFHIRKGHISYINRWVQTNKWKLEHKAKKKFI